MKELVLLFSVCLYTAVCFSAQEVNEEETYIAAVVEYAPDLSPSRIADKITVNVNHYIDIIKLAKLNNQADIVVFPEDGLTGWGDITKSTIDEASTLLPEPGRNNSPCYYPHDKYSHYITQLSCAVSASSVYVVLNIIEKVPDDDNILYYNTDIVFDRTGNIIAKYRKINLFNERLFQPGSELVTFETDFGVAFAVFTCFDIMFMNPALDVLVTSKIKNVIYPSAWFSHLPFYGSLSVQHGYAKSAGINLLASGLNDPRKKNGGSGIYLYDGTIAEAYISGVRETRIVPAKVPKFPRADKVKNMSHVNEESFSQSDISDFVTSHESLVNYTIKALDANANEMSESICSGSFCCTFDISQTRTAGVTPNYVYKLIAYYGVLHIASNRNIAVRNCALVACLNDTDSTCGQRHQMAPKGIIFNKISVKGHYDIDWTTTRPSTLTYYLTPIIASTFHKKTHGNKREVYMTTTKEEDSILTFGILGRVFKYDDTPAGPLNANPPSVMLVL